MNDEEARKVAAGFLKYLREGNEKLIRKYPKKEILMALGRFKSDERHNIWYKAMENRVNEIIQSQRITRRDFIAYAIGIVGIIIAVALGVKNRQLESTKQEVNNFTQIMQQHNYYDSLPEEIRIQINNIAEATGPQVTFFRPGNSE